MAKLQELRPLRMGAPLSEGARATVTRRAGDALRSGHLWVYRTDVEQVQAGPEGPVEAGSLVTVMDARGGSLGTAIFSSASQITLRMVSQTAGLTREAYLGDVMSRVHAAVDLREELAPVGLGEDAYRVIFSEADGLPGIVADRYNDLVVLQLLTQGTAREDVRRVVRETLAERLQPAAILERPDARVRELEQIGPPPEMEEGVKTETVFTINGLRFGYDASTGQKTGAFLDQRLNYAAAARYAHGRGLDVCTYQGGFALHLAERCTSVTGVDASRAALKVADANLLLNPGIAEKKHTDWIEADAFDLLRAYDEQGERFDTIVLDPPAFAKSKRALEGAMRGYKELNLRALKMLNPGGTLVTCSCSHHVGLEEFTGVLASAATDSHRRVQLLETRGAAPDHPAILTLPETTYLKCLIARVL